MNLSWFHARMHSESAATGPGESSSPPESSRGTSRTPATRASASSPAITNLARPPGSSFAMSEGYASAPRPDHGYARPPPMQSHADAIAAESVVPGHPEEVFEFLADLDAHWLLAGRF